MPKGPRRKVAVIPVEVDTFQLSASATVALAINDYLPFPVGSVLDTTRAWVAPWNAKLIQLLCWKESLAGATDIEVMVNGVEVEQLTFGAGDRNLRKDVLVDITKDDVVRFRTSAAILGGAGVTAIFRRRA